MVVQSNIGGDDDNNGDGNDDGGDDGSDKKGNDSDNGIDNAEKDDNNNPNNNNSISITNLLEIGSSSKELSSGIYSATIHHLQNQNDVPFTIVMDEFNCYYSGGHGISSIKKKKKKNSNNPEKKSGGHYFHYTYDPDVRKAIPYHRITLFRPLLQCLGIQGRHYDAIHATNSTNATNTNTNSSSSLEDSSSIVIPTNYPPVPMKRGCLVVGITKSRSVSDSATRDLIQAVEQVAASSTSSTSSVHIVNVPTYSPLEVEHILYNFEKIGIGRMRFDRGSTVMNGNEVRYLGVVSGGVGQKLMDACIM